MFIAASTRPNSAASANWCRERPASAGRVTAHSTMLAVSSRSSTAPPGPTELNSFVAIADPNWTDAIPPMTSAGDGTRASGPALVAGDSAVATPRS